VWIRKDIKGEDVNNNTLRERFDRKGFGVNKYAKANGLDHSTLSRVLSGKLSGTRGSMVGNTRKVIAVLKRDGVWVGKLPWEDRT
jgi:gp16 family phage-associated protein